MVEETDYDESWKEVLEILKGIDECESVHGWWETSAGAEFGKSRLEKLRELWLKKQIITRL